MATVSLFWDTIMAAVTSCENTLLLSWRFPCRRRRSFLKVSNIAISHLRVPQESQVITQHNPGRLTEEIRIEIFITVFVQYSTFDDARLLSYLATNFWCPVVILSLESLNPPLFQQKINFHLNLERGKFCSVGNN